MDRGAIFLSHLFCCCGRRCDYSQLTARIVNFFLGQQRRARARSWAHLFVALQKYEAARTDDKVANACCMKISSTQQRVNLQHAKGIISTSTHLHNSGASSTA